jgi:hypothetical protein
MRLLPPRTARDHRSEAVLLPSFLFLVGGVAALAMADRRYPTSHDLWPLTTACLVQIAVWWGFWITRVSRACSPANLQLIPGLRRNVTIHGAFIWATLATLLGAVFCGFLMAAALTAIIAFALMFRHPATRHIILVAGTVTWLATCFTLIAIDLQFPSIWPALDAGHMAAMWGLAFVVLGFIGVTRAYRWLWTIVCCTYLAASFAGKGALIVDVQYNFIATEFKTGVIGTCGLLVAAALLHWLTVKYLIERQGDRAIERYRYDRGNQANIAVGFGDSDRQVDWSIARTPQARSVARTDKYIASRRTPLELISVSIGPGFKRTDFTGGALIAACVLALVTMLNPSLGKVFLTSGAGKMMLCMPMVICMLPAGMWLGIRQHYRNQALLSLTPNWPRRPILNKWLICFTIELALIGWVGSLVAIMAIVVIHSVPSDLAMRAASGATLVALIVLGCSLQDYSRSRSTSTSRNLNVGFVATMALIPLVGMLVFMPQSPQLLVFILLMLAVCFVCVRIYLRMKGPALLPACRG